MKLFFYFIALNLKFIILKLILLMMTIKCCGQDDEKRIIGTRFPTITGKALSGQQVSIPANADGKITLVSIAFRVSGQRYIDSWADPFLNEYGINSNYTYYEVPLLSTRDTRAQQFIDGGMRAGIDPAMHPNVVTFYGDFSNYRKQLGMTNISSAYIFLLDKEGIIRYHGSGNMEEEEWQALKQMINKIRK